MPKPAAERGTVQHVDLCVGVNGFPGWSGVQRENGPALGGDFIWYAQNMRRKGDIWVSRGGQAKVNTTTLGASIVVEGIFDVDDPA